MPTAQFNPISDQMAREFVQAGLDPNLVAKLTGYLRDRKDGAALFAWLDAIAQHGRPLVGGDQRHYQSIRRVCDRYLRPYADKPDEMAAILGWAVRLMRYYKAEPTLDRPKPVVKAQAPAAARPRAPAQETPAPPMQHPARLEDLRPGMVLPGRVVRIQPYGAFVDVGVGRDGLVHISELREGRVNDVAEAVRPGQEVTVRVKEVNPENKRIALSMKGVPQGR